MPFKELDLSFFSENVFKIIGSDWMLITAEKNGRVNTMTASWGGLGVMWNKNVAFTVIRPQRYTKEFVDGAEKFSLSFLGASFKKELAYLGRVSGRDVNKIAEAGLTVGRDGFVPYFREADKVLICRKMYVQEMESGCFLDKDAEKTWYPDKDYHYLYISEIIKAMIK